MLFYHHKNAAGEEEIHIRPREREVKPEKRKTLRRILLAAGCLFLAAAFGFGYLIASGRINPQIEYVRTMEITAHRGASAVYPENTMAAFQGAWELGADWIELDVQQTKDGQLIIMHDSNTKRTTGVAGNVWDMTYAEIEKLDAGSFFSSRFAGEKIPLLSEAAEFAKETGIRLNIELKPTGHEKDFEKDVIDIIHEYNLEDDCVITSQAYGTLERVKEYDPEIVTVYVMSLAYGNITKLTAADHFSVEASSATGRLVSRVHNAGKQIYAWTVNSENSINSMIERNVDNIITDNIPLARRCVEESRYSDLLTEFIKRLK
jgi:glycerophosphoryl diester phosphodiesterase